MTYKKERDLAESIAAASSSTKKNSSALSASSMFSQDEQQQKRERNIKIAKGILFTSLFAAGFLVAFLASPVAGSIMLCLTALACYGAYGNGGNSFLERPHPR